MQSKGSLADNSTSKQEVTCAEHNPSSQNYERPTVSRQKRCHLTDVTGTQSSAR